MCRKAITADRIGDNLKIIKVVAAVICSSLQHKDLVLVTARGYGAYKGMWEFPGGKVEAGETPRQAIAREIKEELDVEISVGEFIQTIEYDYPEFHLSMDCFWAEISAGQLIIKEALEAKWLSKDILFDVEWLPADLLIIPEIEKTMVSNS